MSSPTPFTESWLSGPQSTNFYTRTYTSSTGTKAVIVFLHGFAEHIGRYDHFHPLFLQHGISVFTFDQRGFGKTALDEDGHKSKNSSYGKTSWKEQMNDIAWAIGHVNQQFPGLPTFVMGHSMGGAEVLGFASQGENSPYYATITSLAGVISTSPLIEQTTPAPKLLRWIGGKASIIAPHMLFPADVKPDDLSHDPSVGDAYMKDPLVKTLGTLRGLHEMLSNGEAILQAYYKDWPKNLPIYLAHGTGDKVTSNIASRNFYEKMGSTDKKLSLFEGGFHELQNEPDGVKEKLAAEIVTFIDAHLNDTPVGDPRPKM